jgi:hypothetical protein
VVIDLAKDGHLASFNQESSLEIQLALKLCEKLLKYLIHFLTKFIIEEKFSLDLFLKQITQSQARKTFSRDQQIQSKF